jgi:hypothetical protein
MGDGAGAFPQNNAYAAGVDTRCLAAGDVNGDGLVDVAAGNQVSATVTFYLGTPGGTPGLQFPALAIAPGLYGLVAADFDRDGHCDLATNRFEVWSGNGAGVFTLTSLPPVGNLVAAVAADDVNADGYLDLLTANYDHGSIGVVPGSVNGFSAAELYAADPTPVALGTRDLDLDGRPDWFAALLFMNSVCASLNLTAAPVGLTPYGAGTSGCHGTLSLLANGPPQIPAPGFLLTCTNAPSNAFGLLLVANASSPSGVDPFGIGAALHVDPFASTEFFGLDMFGGPAGTAHAPAPIPNAPALSGAVYFAQALFLESPGLTCGPSPFRIVSSRGLAVQIP